MKASGNARCDTELPNETSVNSAEHDKSSPSTNARILEDMYNHKDIKYEDHHRDYVNRWN